MEKDVVVQAVQAAAPASVSFSALAQDLIKPQLQRGNIAEQAFIMDFFSFFLMCMSEKFK